MDERRSRHYVADLTAGEQALPADAAHHLARVRRVRPGDRLVLFDGAGREAAAEVVTVAGGAVRVRVDNPRMVTRESPVDFTLVFALSKGQKPEWIVQKAVELGVRRLVIAATERTVARWKDNTADKLARLNTIAVGAAAQCGRNELPVLDYAEDPAALEKLVTPDTARFYADPTAADALGDRLPSQTPLAVFVGPEGGLTPAETKHLQNHGWQPAHLGPRVLRTETAAVAVAALVQAIVGDLTDRALAPPPDL